MSLVIAAFLLAHAGIHAAFLSPRPPATAGGPVWPFELDHSSLLGPLGVESAALRALGVALVALTIGGFSVAALAAIGIAPDVLWTPAVTVGAVASIALITAFFKSWLVLGIAIDFVLLWAVHLGDWTPEGVAV
jgi:hypothetical protein